VGAYKWAGKGCSGANIANKQCKLAEQASKSERERERERQSESRKQSTTVLLEFLALKELIL